MGVELPLRVVVTILECCVTFSGVKLSIRSFVLFGKEMLTDPNRKIMSDPHMGKYCLGKNQSDFRISGPRHVFHMVI